VVAIIAGVGVRVERGAPLMILEAMKMEHTINAPCDGTVAEFHFEVGGVVNEGAELLEFTSEHEQSSP
jgi:3-methylcrotonyl-CoA carboxylase alpha subunit